MPIMQYAEHTVQAYKASAHITKGMNEWSPYILGKY